MPPPPKKSLSNVWSLFLPQIWHTHQVHPELYGQDTSAILGFVLNHDDSVNDRSDGSKLNKSDEVTRKLWLDTFNVPFARPGSMFRSAPSMFI